MTEQNGTEPEISPETVHLLASLPFEAQLQWHFDAGTRRPDKKESGLWTTQKFADACGVHEKSVRNWLKGDDVSVSNRNRIELELFGPDPSHAAAYRRLLREAYARRGISRDGPAPADPPAMELKESNIDSARLCLGRDGDIADLIAALVPAENGGSALVLGGPGFGKTTITEKVALHPDMVARFGPRRWIIKLADVTSAAGILTRIAETIGLQTTAQPAAIKLRLAEAPSLLVLDNLETPWHADRTATESALRDLLAIPSVALIASLRSDSPIVDVDWDYWLTLKRLDRDTAVAAFRATAKRDFADDDDMAFFLDRTARIPLAIYLTAKYAAQYQTLAVPRAEWEKFGQGEITTEDGKEGTRDGDLTACIEFSLSHKTVGEPGRRLFGFLGQLPAGMAREDRDALLGPDAARAERQIKQVGLLTDEREDRLDLLPPIREVAHLPQHAPSQQDAALWTARYLETARVEGARVGKAGSAAAVATLVRELPNISAAMLHVANQPDRLAEPLAVVEGLARAVRYAGIRADRLFDSLRLVCKQDGDRDGQAACLLAKAGTAYMRSENDAARAMLREAGDLLAASQSTKLQADIQWRTADIERMQARFEPARSLYEQARTRYAEAGALTGEADCLWGVAGIERMQDRNDLARSLYEQARTRYAEAGALTGEADCLWGLAEIERMQDRYDPARSLYEQARTRYAEAGDLTGEAACLAGLAGIERAHGHDDKARPLYAGALERWAQAGTPYGEGWALEGLAWCAERAGNRREACRLLARAEAKFTQAGDAGQIRWVQHRRRVLGCPAEDDN